MDPYAVLGVRPGSGDKEIAAAYREAAKRWHPDVAPGDEAAAARMAEINAAYDLVRAAEQHEAQGPWRPGDATPATFAAARGPGKGGWLIPPLRLALGPELLNTLNQGEDVKLVTPTSTWASPRAILAVTERRLLWLLDDAPVARVHSLVFPPDPLLHVGRAANAVFSGLGRTLEDLSAALDTSDRPQAERTLEAARAIDDDVRALGDALALGRDTARSSNIPR